MFGPLAGLIFRPFVNAIEFPPWSRPNRSESASALTFQTEGREAEGARAGVEADGAAADEPGLGADEGERRGPRLDRGEEGGADGGRAGEGARVQGRARQDEGEGARRADAVREAG